MGDSTTETLGPQAINDACPKTAPSEALPAIPHVALGPRNRAGDAALTPRETGIAQVTGEK